MKKIFITGGAGYVGSVLVPKLLDNGYEVTVIDLMIYGENVLPTHERLTAIRGDIRDTELMRKIIPGHDAIIHLACISNDPSFELNPDLGKSINLDPFEPMVQIAKASGVKRFIYASSSSVYGIKEEPNVTEDMSLEPLTDYSKFKAECEKILKKYESDDFTAMTIRPATVCGYSPRLRLDLTVNILTNFAINKGFIKVFGGEQKRPNIHIQDMTDLYCLLLELPSEKIQGKIFNAGYENFKVKEIAQMVKNVVGEVDIRTESTNDNRSYHISSDYIKQEIGFEPKHSIEDAVSDLKEAFEKGLINDSFENEKYFNVKLMQNIELS
ncbi:MAG: UDP-glucose 4-epimerase [Verrucomicrobia bacterium]|nr:UDP-glucose 4-epimerase [Verrucomicrobiota bacterium]|tara:strand:+ start:272 stop:1249 length:978 start_codon:yes stop_codon:yes gene_type:complete